MHQTDAQNSTDYMTYRNPSLGFSIEHPPDWPANETFSEKKVMFGPTDSIMPMFMVRVMDLYPYLDTDTLTVKNKTLDKVVQEFRTNISNPKPNILGLEFETKVIRQNQVIVGGNPGWKFEMTMLVGPENDRAMYAYFYAVFTVANGKLYFLEYDEKPLKVPETLPIANKMVDSFRIIPIEPLKQAENNNNNESTKDTISPVESRNQSSTFELIRDIREKPGFASIQVYNSTQNASK